MGNAFLLSAKYGASSEPVVIHDYQTAQYYGSLVVGTPNEEITCTMTQAHPICGCPTQIVAMVLKSQFLPQSKSSTYVANGSTFKIEYGSEPVSGFYSKDTVNIGGVSITDYTFAEVTNVSELGFRTLWGNFDKICGMA